MIDISRIIDLPIVSVIEKYITLKRNGANYKACCPFHDEKTASLVVSPSKNIYKCFGCGKGGGGINFVMEHQKLEFWDAVKLTAKNHGIDLPERKMSDEERVTLNNKDNLRKVNKIAAAFFEQNLYKPENKKILDYALSRWDAETIRMFGIGYALDDWHALEKHLTAQGVKRDFLINSGLIGISSTDHTNTFDYFRNRLIIPILDHLGRNIGFTGRAFNDKDAKYFNTKETLIFKKGEMLFGFNTARRHILERRLAILVEGNVDVIKMHQIGVNETVGSQGTALTSNQIKLLQDAADSVTIIGDNDNAGKIAVIKNAKALITSGLFVNVIPLISEEGEKADPDSMFTSKKQYNDYANDNIQSFILWYAHDKKAKSKSSDRDAQIINEIATLLTHLPESVRTLQIEDLAKIIKPKTAWTDALKKAISDIEQKPEKDAYLDAMTQKQADSVKRYGFYEEDNCYYFQVKDGFSQGSNFTMKPLFHVQSVSNAKRLYSITNMFNHQETIELDQRDMISLQGFKLRIESLGNFLWDMSDIYLNKLKRYLYENTQTCVAISQLGWQKQGFFAWGNGMFCPETAIKENTEKAFMKVDEYGIINHKGLNYYLPAFSSIYKGEDSLFQFERKFIHTECSHINLYDYLIKMRLVFGNNSLIAFSFFLGTLFRDIIAHRFSFYPILNCFGPKGTGKTQMAESLMSFFGIVAKGPNINNTTKAALGDHVSQVSNGCVHIDEYRNDVEIEKIEFLKGCWDGTGRTRMNMDKDKKKETTAVDCGVILTGQQMPTADIALFSRLVYITFYQTNYNQEEKARFTELKDIEKHGLSHITNDILTHRSYFLKNYSSSYDIVCDDLQKHLDKNKIEDRIFRNWAVILAATHCLMTKITIPFNYNELIDIAIEGINTQAAETFSSNELSTFWQLVQYMDTETLIAEQTDYRLDYTNIINLDRNGIKIDMQRPEPIKIIYINFNRIINLYRKLGSQQKLSILPADTIKRYLMNSPSYLGKKSSMRFTKLDKNNQKVMVRKDNDDLSELIEQKFVTVAYAFEYDQLNINLTFNTADENNNDNLPF